MICTRHIALCLAISAVGFGTATAFAQRNPRVSTKPAGKSPGTTRAPEKTPLVQPAESDSGLFDAAMKGDAQAQTKLGKAYVGEDDPARVKQGSMLLEAAAKQNNADALYALGVMSVTGRGVPRSDAAAFDYMWRAAEAGLPDAQYDLALMYADGKGTVKNSEAATKWAQKAENQGCRKALPLLGRLMLESADYQAREDALAMMQRAADEGRTEAILFLARTYSRGEFGVPIDENRAEKLLKPVAETGDAECQFALASLYRFGSSYENQRDLATQWLQRAADLGLAKAVEILKGEQSKLPEQ